MMPAYMNIYQIISAFALLVLVSLPLSLPEAAKAADIEAEKPILQADEIALDQARNVITATGNVELRYQGQRLYAEKLDWHRGDNRVIAEGQVRIHEANGTITHAERVQLSTSLKTGTIEAMRIALPEGAWVKAARAVRDHNRTTLEDAEYSACAHCPNTAQNAGDKKSNAPPLWSVRASKIVYDTEAQNVHYRHARLMLRGLPVFYTPYLAHPGPKVKRRSGFLAPAYVSSSTFGFGVETPYYFALAENYDLTISPRFTAKQGVVLGGTWRHLVAQGQYNLTAHLHKAERSLDTIDGKHSVRGGIIGQGQFVSNQDWRVGFRLEESSDDIFFRRYNIHARTVLESNLVVQKQIANHDLLLSGYRYRRTLSDETDTSVDFIAPRIIHQYKFGAPVLGGTLRMRNEFVHSIRNKGLDISEGGTQWNWTRRDILRGGVVVDLENRLDADAYHFADEPGDPIQAPTASEGFAANSFSAALSYPVVRHSATTTQTLTPKMQLVAASDNDRYDTIPYRTKPLLDLSTRSLFDLQTPEDEASRLNYALSYNVEWASGAAANMLIGQSYNLSARGFSRATGYRKHASAIFTEATINYGIFSAAQNLRLSAGGDKLLRNYTGLKINRERFALSANYSFLESGEVDANRHEEVYFTTAIPLNDFWRLNGTVREDLEHGRRVSGSTGLNYEDECTDFTITFSRDYTHAGGIKAETQIKLVLVLKTLTN